MPAQFQLALFGALPAILAMAYFDHLDAKRPEPQRTLRLVALAGALSAVVVVALGAWLQSGSPPAGTYASAMYSAYVVAAAPEEAAKLACILLVAWRRPEFDERMDGVVYGARAGLGFALVENIAYLWIVPHSLSEFISLFAARAVLAVPGHACWGALLGYFAAKRRFDGRGPGMLGGYLVAVFLHGSYDAVLFATPIAVEHGHTVLTLGLWGVPVLAYVVPALIVLGSAAAVMAASRRAIAADDRDPTAGSASTP